MYKKKDENGRKLNIIYRQKIHTQLLALNLIISPESKLLYLF